MNNQIVWNSKPTIVRGEPLELRRMCECGCDHRAHPNAVGYLIGCDPAGSGVTVFIESEEVFRRLARVMGPASATSELNSLLGSNSSSRLAARCSAGALKSI